MSDLREQVAIAIGRAYWRRFGHDMRAVHPPEWYPEADAALAVFAEREREAATEGYVVGAKHAAERCAEREREHDLSASIGEWIITTSRESPGRRICTGWVIDGREVLVGIFGDAKQEPKDRRWWAR